MFLWAERKGIHVNTIIRVSSVRLVGLHVVEVRPFTLRESVLAVKLELSGDDGVHAPAVEEKGCLREHECAGIRDTRVVVVAVGGKILELGKNGVR